MKNKYRVEFTGIVSASIEVEAESEDEAIQIAKENDFKLEMGYYEKPDEWSYNDITQITFRE